MPSEITHAVYAERFLKLHPEYQRREFFIGTLFPDIRYMANIPRDTTHSHNLTLEHVLAEPDSFRAGMLYHSLMDDTWGQLFENYGILPYTSHTLSMYNALKSIEDDIRYNETDIWAEVTGYLADIISPELNFGVATATISHWHKIIAAEFMRPSGSANRWRFMAEEIISSDEEARIQVWIDKLRHDPLWLGRLDAYSDQVDAING